MNEIAIQENRHMTAAEIRANVNLIQEVMKAVMLKDIHYGTIPGTQKPTLYKAGSEKILSTFRIAVELDVDDLSTHDCFRYRVKARGVIPTGEIVGCGIGECSTDEEKYKWRGAVSQKEFDATPEDRKRVKYTKSYETNQVRTNPADLANTVLKMAKKRAQIDLTLTATAASDVSEQDLEDMPDDVREHITKDQAKGKPAVNPPQAKKLTESQAEYFPRVKAALDAIHSDDTASKKATIKELTAFKAKDGKQVEGVEDYRTLDGKRLEILCHNLEKKVPQKEEVIPGRCVECGGEIVGEFCSEPSCPGYQEPDNG